MLAFFVLTEICETLSLPTAATATTTVATTINIIKPITMPLPSTVEQSTEPSGLYVAHN